MSRFILLTLNHIHAVKVWADAHDGHVSLNLRNFELEVKARHRYFHLEPRFLVNVGGRMAHVGQLTPEVTGFIGWLPYLPIRLTLSTDKLAFKRYLGEVGVRTPTWQRGTTHPRADFIIKRSLGSFGYDLAGPFQAGDAVDAKQYLAPGMPESEIYAEAFVAGRILKVWCWGGTAFHAHLHEYPRVIGNGADTLNALIVRRLAEAGQDFTSGPDAPYIRGSVAYQGFDLEEVVPIGQSVWLDFRYGRRFSQQKTTEEVDNALPHLLTDVRAQIDDAVQKVSAAFFKEVQAPVLFSLDAILDDGGAVWWLESNSNPILPPTGYAHMFGTLFDVPVRPPDSKPAICPEVQPFAHKPTTRPTHGTTLEPQP